MAETGKSGGQENRGLKLVVPLDASGIEGFKPEQRVKVLVVGGEAKPRSVSVELDGKGAGEASFAFARPPGAVQIIVGPEGATDDELQALQTLRVDISQRQWADTANLKLPPLRISPYYWWWWLRWCRTFVIRGRVVCANGSPVPGAKVCAYDVDRWFIWCNTQLVGCSTTDVNGVFELRFRWCCGWWPWWWWRQRIWQVDPFLARQVGDVLRRAPDLRLSPAGGNQPSLAVFKGILGEQGMALNRPLSPTSVNTLEQVRTSLLQKLPASAELERLRIWPWWPWWPWWDCTPDIIFKVTQDCLTPGTVIVDEGCNNTRWDIPNPLSVTLIANDKACCLPQCHDPTGKPCPDGECVVIERICSDPITDIGGNPGAAAAPAGYLHPGAVAPGAADYNGDRPFAGVIPLEKNFNDMLNVDYLEVEQSPDGVTWSPLPTGAAVDFTRLWMETVGFTTGTVAFPFTVKLDAGAVAHTVVESREHSEATGGLGGWNANRFWLVNRDLVVPLDSTKFTDGTYQFRVVGWQIGGGGELVNRKVLPVCGTEKENKLILTFDNQVQDPMTHDPSHNCGGGIHVCTQEPDTAIIQVRVNGTPVGACKTVDSSAGTLEIDFQAHDTDGHLAVYSLIATYGVNQAVNLLNRPGSTVTALVAGIQTGWKAAAPANVDGTYGVALSQGAVAPLWSGGTFRLTAPLNEAFPIPCCYQLELRAWKRTIVGGASGIGFGCDHGYAHNNLSEFTIGVGVCPPQKG